MSGITFEPTANTDQNSQPCILRYDGSNPIVSLKTENGVEISLVPHPTKAWFRAEDGGGDCLYGR